MLNKITCKYIEGNYFKGTYKDKKFTEYGEAMLEGAYEQYKKVITVEEDGTVVDVKLYIQEGNNVFKGVESYSL